MKLEVRRYSIRITPENKIDEAYLEEVLGLEGDGAFVKATRVHAMGLLCMAYVEIKKDE